MKIKREKLLSSYCWCCCRPFHLKKFFLTWFTLIKIIFDCCNENDFGLFCNLHLNFPFFEITLFIQYQQHWIAEQFLTNKYWCFHHPSKVEYPGTTNAFAKKKNKNKWKSLGRWREQQPPNCFDFNQHLFYAI